MAVVEGTASSEASSETTTTTTTTTSTEISEAEATLYDRQIRLWGLDAQRRLRAAKVFVHGLTGLGCEVTKNVILAGVDAMTLCDPDPVKPDDFDSAFFLPRESVGKNRAEAALPRVQKLNPMVKLTADSLPLKEKDDAFFQAFDVVVVTDASEDDLLSVADRCHRLKVKFFAGDVFGIHGFCFADLGEHDYAEDVQRPVKTTEAESADGDSDEPPEKRRKPDGTGDAASNDAPAAPAKKPTMETVVIKKHASFPSLRKAWVDFDWKAEENQRQLKRLSESYAVTRVVLRYRTQHGGVPDPQKRAEVVPALESLAASYLPQLGLPVSKLSPNWASFALAALSPACAIVGGVLGGEVIKAVSLKDAPHDNFFFYNGFQGDGFVERIGHV